MVAPVMTRNRKPGPTHFQDDVTGRKIDWKGAGDPNGGDYTHVPAEVLENPDFMRAVRKGVIEVLDDSEEVKDIISTQAAMAQAIEERRAADQEAVMHRPQDASIVGTPCVGPNPRGNGTCDRSVPVREKEAHDRPPLCTEHSHLADEFVIEEYDFDNDTGLAKKRWVKVTVGGQLSGQTKG